MLNQPPSPKDTSADIDFQQQVDVITFDEMDLNRPSLPSKPEPANPKRKREQKGKDVVEVGRSCLAHEDEAQRAAKQQKEQIATLKKKLEEAQKLKDQAEKLKAKIEKAKIEAEKARDRAEQDGYDVSVAKTKDTFRAKVPAEQLKEPEVSKETSSNKTAEVPQDGAASQGFEQALASITMPVEGAPKEKEKTIPTESAKPANKTFKDKLQIKLKQ
ncbi:uncharacterized protein LOC126721287 [Quercus robur]|uniref:uncharacterized protein LOC126721287 n=1 Tax=Quercus robur TaxID=38942 RepID=UPI0021623FFE|nr:uncharacterized protein LOC126721287 [Quercus robur]